ncbi:hypothetical protein GCM10027398_32660 [Azotobacter salinestris]
MPVADHLAIDAHLSEGQEQAGIAAVEAGLIAEKAVKAHRSSSRLAVFAGNGGTGRRGRAGLPVRPLELQD